MSFRRFGLSGDVNLPQRIGGRGAENEKRGFRFHFIGDLSELPEDIRDTAGSLGADNLSRSVLAAALWKRLLYWCDHLDDPALMEVYRKHSVVLGKEITYTYNNQLMQGKAVSIDDDGHLIIEKPDHSTQVLQSGEVSIRSWQRS